MADLRSDHKLGKFFISPPGVRLYQEEHIVLGSLWNNGKAWLNTFVYMNEHLCLCDQLKHSSHVLIPKDYSV